VLFQIIMIPLIMVVANLGIYGTIWAIARSPVLAMPLLTLIFRNFTRACRAAYQCRDHGLGQLLADLRRDIPPMSGTSWWWC
jgi:hypothetical protein